VRPTLYVTSWRSNSPYVKAPEGSVPEHAGSHQEDPGGWIGDAQLIGVERHPVDRATATPIAMPVVPMSEYS